MSLLTRFVPSAHASHSFSLLHVNSRLERCIRARTLLSNSPVSEERCREELRERVDVVEKLLSGQWLMPQPSTRISKIAASRDFTEGFPTGIASQRTIHGFLENLQFANEGYLDMGDDGDDLAFYVIRDDLLHPLLGGNKLRKLDALIPELERMEATDVVTCGGCQSAHTAALAFACAERGISAHLLLRGDKPVIPTGYNLLCGMYGHVTYVPRSEYADRAIMLSKHAFKLAANSGSVSWVDECEITSHSSFCTETQEELPEKKSEGMKKTVVVVKEGAGDAIALLGLIRLVHYLSQPTVFGPAAPLHIVVDTGTGTTAVGVALGIALLGLPWKVTGVMLADSVENYQVHQLKLISDFSENFSLSSAGDLHLPLLWEQRLSPRKFGKVLPGEIEICQSIARQTGILLDPIYTLAGWETTVRYSTKSKDAEKIVMLHTGGTLGLFGLAQRFPALFS